MGKTYSVELSPEEIITIIVEARFNDEFLKGFVRKVFGENAKVVLNRDYIAPGALVRCMDAEKEVYIVYADEEEDEDTCWLKKR